ncbi:DUF5367 family protein [Roseivirga sp.]|uniref:DUF5367 family protein n=1 Tax=Roseivirga sp. TaxID=1964215 RepID=UPI003B523216
MDYKRFSIGFGFLIWLLASLVFRFWGNYFFDIQNSIVVIGLFLGVTAPLFGLVFWVIKRFKLNRERGLKSTMLMALPGMFSDVICIRFHALAFPAFNQEQVIFLAAWILWAYLIVLGSGCLCITFLINGTD